MSEINYDEITKRIKAAMGRGRDEFDYEDDYDDRGGRGRGGRRVPYDRFAAVLRERDEARKQLEDLGGQVDALKTQQETALADLRQEAAKQVKELQLRHVEDLALVDAGFGDPLGRAALRQAWEAQPKADRGESPSAWWSSMMEARAAHAEDDSKPAPSVPATLRGYLPQEEAPPANNQRRGAPPPKAPKARGGGGELPEADNMQDWLQQLSRAG